MAKTANLVVRLEPEVKEKAEAILKKMGLSASTAVDMFYKQVIVDEGLPFVPKLKKPISIDDISKKKLDELIYEGIRSAKNEELTEASSFLKELKNSTYDL